MEDKNIHTPETGGGVQDTSTTGGDPKPQDTEPVKGPKEQPQADGDEKVVVTKTQLRGILADMKEEVREEFSKEIGDLKTETKILREASDEKRLFQVESRNQGALVRTLKVNTYEGKIIMGWKMSQDVVQKNPQTGVWIEKQSIVIMLDDDSKIEFQSYLAFDDMKRSNQKLVKILGREDLQDGSGQQVYRVEHPFKKGEEVRISSPFVN